MGMDNIVRVCLIIYICIMRIISADVSDLEHRSTPLVFYTDFCSMTKPIAPALKKYHTNTVYRAS
jgi:hypothetical protein